MYVQTRDFGLWMAYAADLPTSPLLRHSRACAGVENSGPAVWFVGNCRVQRGQEIYAPALSVRV